LGVGLEVGMERSQLSSWQAVEMAQFKAGFLARTSHELRSPLNGLISGLQLILSDLCDDVDEEREYVKIAHDSALKLVELMDQVMLVSKVEMGSQSLKMQAVDLDILLQEVYFLTRMQAKNRNIRYEIPMLDDEVEVIADMNILRQALMSLIDGAVLMMDEGSITVETYFEGGRAYMAIVATPSPLPWSEPLVLTETPADRASLPALSPSFRLRMSQALFEEMNGGLEIVDRDGVLQIQCYMPMV
jgi:signal transduction histidine kinase